MCYKVVQTYPCMDSTICSHEDLQIMQQHCTCEAETKDTRPQGNASPGKIPPAHNSTVTENIKNYLIFLHYVTALTLITKCGTL